MKTLGKYCFGALITLAASIASVHLAILAYVRLYAFRLGVPLNSLSNDYGLAIEIALVSIFTFVSCLALGFAVTHRIISSNLSERNHVK